MMSKALNKAFVIVLLLVIFKGLCFNAFAQSPKSNRNTLSVSVDEGVFSFFGDLRFSSFHPFSIIENSSKFGMGFGIEKTISSKFSLQAKVNMGTLSGYEVDKNLYFESTINEISLNSRIYIRERTADQISKKRFYPYVSFGFGMVNYKTSLQTYDLRQVLNYPKDKTTIIIPASLGFNLNLTDQFDFNFDFGFRICGNDYIDEVKSGGKVDMYSYSSVGLIYKFGQNKKKKVLEELETIPVTKLPEKIIEKEDTSNINKIVTVEYEEPEEKNIKTDTIQIGNITNDTINKDLINKEDNKIEKTEIDSIKKKTIEKPTKIIEEDKLVIGLEYRLQIGASKNKEDYYTLINEHNIREQGKVEWHKGMYKFTIGSFDNFNDARKFMNKYVNRKEFSDAYLVAYRNGIRLDKFPIKR
ncbi:SPOR domain-containing protein [Bacteroidota bacterium]